MLHLNRRACVARLTLLRLTMIALFVTGAANAVTVTVPCSGSGGGASGLITAIETANSTPGASTINLTPGCVYRLTTQYAGQSQNGLPPVTGTLTINGYGATIERRQISGTPGFRIFAVASYTGFPNVFGDLTLNTVTLKGGQVTYDTAQYGSLCEDGVDAMGQAFFDIGFGGGVCRSRRQAHLKSQRGNREYRLGRDCLEL